MIENLQETVARAAQVLERDEEDVRSIILSLHRAVAAKEIAPGDFYFQTTGGIHVQRIHYVEDGLGEIEIFVRIGVDYCDEVSDS